jgi:type I restriction enzyme S subunit
MTIVPLQQLLELSDSGVWGDEDVESGISVLRSTNFNNDGTIDFSKLTFRAIEERKRETKIIQDGDILLEKSGGGPKQPVGRVCLFRGHAIPHSFGNFIARLRPKADILSEFLFYFLWHFHAQGKTSHYQKQTTGIRNLETKRFLNIGVPVPPLPEQRRIVDLLSRAEGIVRLRREAEKKAAELIPALFLDMFGDPATNPKGWMRTQLGTLLDSIDSGQSPKCHGQQKQPHQWGVLKLSALSGGFYREVEHKTLPDEISPDDSVEVRSGDVLISRKNTYELVGTAAYVEKTNGRILLPDLIFRLNISDAEQLNPMYLWGLLSMKSKREQIRKLASGSAGSMPNISKARLKTLEVELPPHQEQVRFSLSVEKIRSIQSQQSTATAKAKATFDALLAKAFEAHKPACDENEFQQMVKRGTAAWSDVPNATEWLEELRDGTL